MKTLKIIGIILFEMIMFQDANSQDRLFLKSGRELPVFIQKETTDEIYFTDTVDAGSLFKILKSDLKQINYAKGDSIVFTAQISQPGDSAHAEAAGEKADVRRGTYYCWIYGDTAFSQRVRRAYIHSVIDSGIVFRIFASGNSFMGKNWLLSAQNASDIKQIKIRRKGSVGKGILIGAGIGFVIGGALGWAGIPDYGILETLPQEENALAGGTLFSIPGMVIGGIIGSLRVKIPINKNQLQYKKYKKVIETYSNTKT